MVKSTLHIIENEQFDCNKCMGQFLHRPDPDRLLRHSRMVKGCEVPHDKYIHHINREIKFNRCIGNYMNHEVMGVYEMYEYFDKGILPYSGSLVDQPNKIMEIFNIIGRWKRDKLEQANENMRNKMNKGKR